MMKRTLLMSALCLLSAGIKANPDTEKTWSEKITAVTEMGDFYLQAPTAVDQAGATLVTGQFTQPLSIGDAYLEPVANSAYLAKYNTDGQAAWAIALQGAATIISMDTDEKNNIYIAGTLADKVTFGSTDDKNQTVSGKAEETNKVTSFIALYNAAGQLQTVKTFFTETDEEVASSELYLQEAGYPFFTIKHIEVDNGRLYVSASYTGDFKQDKVNWEGRYLDVFGFAYQDQTSGGIFSLNAEKLDDAQHVANVQNADDKQMMQTGYEGLAFTADKGTVYLSFIGTGKIKYQTAGKSEIINFEFNGDNGMIEHGYAVSAIKGQDVTTQTFHTEAHNISTPANTLEAMAVQGDTLYIGGTFQNTLGFDTRLTSKGKCDLYVSALNVNTLKTLWSQHSNLDEGNEKYYSENFTTMLPGNSSVTVYGYTLKDQDNQKEITAPVAFLFGQNQAKQQEESLLTTSIAQNNGIYSSLAVNTKTWETNISSSVKSTSAIENIPVTDIQRTGNTFYMEKAGNWTIYDMQGRVICQLQQTNCVNLDGLQKGIYILTDGHTVLKVQK